MSLHSSLRQATGRAGTLRNVLKRHERLRDLLGQGRFLEGNSVYGLPKTKQIRVKVRKAAKEAPAEGAAAPAQGAAAATTKAAPAAGKAAPAAGKAASTAGKPAGKSA